MKDTLVEPKYFFVSFTFCSVALCTTFNKHSPLKGHLVSLLQLQVFVLLLKILWLWEFMILFMLGKQLYDNFIVPLLDIVPYSLFLWKCNLTNFWNSLPTLVFTKLLNRELSYVFESLFLIFLWLYGIFVLLNSRSKTIFKSNQKPYNAALFQITLNCCV